MGRLAANTIRVQVAPDDPTYFDHVSPREGQILYLLGAGMSKPAIAKELQYDAEMVRTMMERVRVKYGVRGRALLALAVKYRERARLRAAGGSPT